MQEEAGVERLIADAVPGLVWCADRRGRCRFVNRAWRDFTGRPADRRPAWVAAIHPQDRARCRASHRAALDGGEAAVVEYRLRRHDGRWRWIADRLAALRAEDGSVTGLVGCGMDVDDRRMESSALRLALDERNALLAELQHRVRNMVQMIASMLIFQARRAGGGEAARLLGRSARRVRVMGIAQDRLLARADPTSRVDLARYLSDLARELVRASETDVRLETTTEEMPVLAATAAPLGFIATELIANALQHAFKERGKGSIRLELRREGGSGVALIGDDGIGLGVPTWQQAIDPDSTRIGLALVAGLARQARAQIASESVGGTGFRITFPLP
ncbi:MAG TPA: PAS domain-containing protein [Geminicoccaceae bacterium]|nr:PAS domain-containing protein [Geminicoccus sp.]HMU49715.1 PAS domain-containing protein [Geminicoccaceae bacterium]